MARITETDPDILRIRDLTRDKRDNIMLDDSIILESLANTQKTSMNRAREVARNSYATGTGDPLARALHARKVAMQAARAALAAHAGRKRIADRNAKEETPEGENASRLADLKAMAADADAEQFAQSVADRALRGEDRGMHGPALPKKVWARVLALWGEVKTPQSPVGTLEAIRDIAGGEQ